MLYGYIYDLFIFYISQGKETEHYFLKHGAYLGALGSLLKTLNSDIS